MVAGAVVVVRGVVVDGLVVVDDDVVVAAAVDGGASVVVVVVVVVAGAVTRSESPFVGRPAIAAPASAPTMITSTTACQLRLTEGDDTDLSRRSFCALRHRQPAIVPVGTDRRPRWFDRRGQQTVT
jgi:hypothetical protein